ncbi:MAG: hypothetical protein MOGMAGMI_02447 [Candidatus Omnitrophica bacterium]|nr:hypothetical protein [Candidatus Omnitrophota bacterium]
MTIVLPDGDRLDPNELAEYAVDLTFGDFKRRPEPLPYHKGGRAAQAAAHRSAVRRERHDARALARRVKGGQ